MRDGFQLLKVLPLLSLLLATAAVAAGSIFSPSTEPEPSKRWALLIGISNYTHAEPLQYAAADATALSDFLKSPRGGKIPAEQVITLTEDQSSRYNTLIELEMMQDRVLDGDTVYIYVAGHGLINRRGLGYFIPSDGDLRVPAATSISFAVLKELVELGLAHAQRRVLITDLCHAGRIGPHKSDLAQKIQNLINAELLKLDAGGGTFLNMLASRPSEASWERDDLQRGVFTYVLLEALNGKASGERQDLVLAKDLVDYVKAEVPKYTADQQHPMSNEDFEPTIPLSFPNLPGPSPVMEAPQTYLALLNAGAAGYERAEWTEPATQSKATRLLEARKEEIPSLQAGPFQLSLYGPEDREKTITVALEAGENQLDLSELALGRDKAFPVRASQLASLSPWPAQALPPTTVSGLPKEATLVLRLDPDTRVYLDQRSFGRSGQ